MSDASQAYSTVIADLRARIAYHQGEIQSLETTLKVIKAAAPTISNGAATPSKESQGRYATLGYRKSILIYLADNHDQVKKMDTVTISNALQAGGMTTTGVSFTSNVSATLSDMAKKYGEVIRHDDGTWELTTQGWARGKNLSAQVPYPSELPQPYEQFQNA